MSRDRFLACWGWPLALGVASAAGLIGALLADGMADLLATAALSTPMAAAAWYIARARR
jgi:hypothetical protein